MENSIKLNDITEVLEGFKLVADAVGSSLGAQGGLALIENNNFGAFPIMTKDGITIAKMINPKNKRRALGATLAKNISAKSLMMAGDSTSTSLVIAQSLIENLSGKFNPDVAEGVEIACKETLSHLKKLKRKTKDSDVRAIATISTNNNKELGNLIFDAYKATNERGVIGIEKDLNSAQTSLRISKGMRLEKGFKSPYLINNQSNFTFEAEDCNILVFEGNISIDNIAYIGEFLNQKKGESILIVCEQMTDDVLNLIIDNNNKGVAEFCVVEAPFFADQRKAILNDLALYTNTVSHVQGASKKFTWGNASKVIVDHNTCTLIQEEVSEEVKTAAENLKNHLNSNPPEKEFIQKRIINLEGNAATIVVGGQTDVELNERYDRVDDAVNAVRTAISAGWVAGGGTALSFVETKLNTKFDNANKQFGYDAFKKSLNSPLQKICENSRIENTEEYLKASKEKYGMGYNAATNKLNNLIKDGVIDSLKSTEAALINSKSVVNLLMNVKVVITYENEGYA